MVSVLYRKLTHGKGVIGVHQYQENSEKYAQIVCDKFPDRLWQVPRSFMTSSQIVCDKFPDLFEKSANPKGRCFMQDNDLSQNSYIANEAFEQVKAFLFKIPPRSPDLNLMENIFHLASNQIRLDAKKQGIKKENFTQFSHRCKKVLLDFSSDIIHRTVASMNKCIQMVINNQGQRRVDQVLKGCNKSS